MGVDVDGDHSAGRSDDVGEEFGVVAAGSHLAHGHAGLQAEAFDHVGLEPGGGHRAGGPTVLVAACHDGEVVVVGRGQLALGGEPVAGHRPQGLLYRGRARPSAGDDPLGHLLTQPRRLGRFAVHARASRVRVGVRGWRVREHAGPDGVQGLRGGGEDPVEVGQGVRGVPLPPGERVGLAAGDRAGVRGDADHGGQAGDAVGVVPEQCQHVGAGRVGDQAGLLGQFTYRRPLERLGAFGASAGQFPHAADGTAQQDPAVRVGHHRAGADHRVPGGLVFFHHRDPVEAWTAQDHQGEPVRVEALGLFPSGAQQADLVLVQGDVPLLGRGVRGERGDHDERAVPAQ